MMSEKAPCFFGPQMILFCPETLGSAERSKKGDKVTKSSPFQEITCSHRPETFFSNIETLRWLEGPTAPLFH
jgi:hypothetical protein